MMILGVILLLIGLIFGIGILWIIGLILLLVGAVLYLAGRGDRTVGGRAHWY